MENICTICQAEPSDGEHLTPVTLSDDLYSRSDGVTYPSGSEIQVDDECLASLERLKFIEKEKRDD